MLLSKKIIVNGHATHMRLNKQMWNELSEICTQENISIDKLCSLIDTAKGNSPLSSMVRLFVLSYRRQR